MKIKEPCRFSRGKKNVTENVILSCSQCTKPFAPLVVKPHCGHLIPRAFCRMSSSIHHSLKYLYFHHENPQNVPYQDLISLIFCPNPILSSCCAFLLTKRFCSGLVVKFVLIENSKITPQQQQSHKVLP